MAEELVEAKSREVALPSGAWGAADEVTPDDFLISKVLLMQALSDQVVNGDAKMGQYRDSVTGELYAAEDENFEALCIYRDMTWVVFEDGEYKETVPLTDENRNLPIEDGKIQRNKTFNFYLLPLKGIEESPASVVPAVLSLKRTGLRTAKAMQTHYNRLAAENLPSAHKVTLLGSSKKTNDRGTFAVPTFSVGRETTREEQLVAYQWYKNLVEAKKKNKVRVDDSDEKRGAGRSEKPTQELDDEDIPF